VTENIVNKKMMAVFLAALIIRGILFLHILDYPSGILQPDSKMYISLAQGLQEYGNFSYPDHPDRPDVERMPGYPIFVAYILSLFGGSLLAVVIVQIILDSLSCVLIYWLAEKLWNGNGLIAGLLAAINIGMITYAHFILNDSFFLFIFLFLLLAIFKFLKVHSWKFCLIIGSVMGISAYVRPVIIYLPIFLGPIFFCFLLFHARDSICRAGGKAAVMVLMFMIIISPWLLRNYFDQGRLKLTAQGGEHLLQYVVPFVWQYSRGIPFIEGMKKANEEFAKKMEKDSIQTDNLGPFQKNELQVGMALDYLKKEPKIAIIKAWFFGMVKNLFAPAIIDMSYLLGIERPHFFYTEGKTLIDRTWNFIKGMKGFFGWIVIFNILLIGISRVIQLYGLWQLMKKRIWEGLLFILIIGYFLLVSGPVGYAKYRLPFEPILIVLMAIGLKDLYGTMEVKYGKRPWSSTVFHISQTENIEQKAA